MHEFMSGIPGNVVVPVDNVEERWVDDNESICALSISDFIQRLQDSHEFHDHPTKEIMEKELQQYISELIVNLKEESEWMIKNVMPLFLKKDLIN